MILENRIEHLGPLLFPMILQDTVIRYSRFLIFVLELFQQKCLTRLTVFEMLHAFYAGIQYPRHFVHLQFE